MTVARSRSHMTRLGSGKDQEGTCPTGWAGRENKSPLRAGGGDTAGPTHPPQPDSCGGHSSASRRTNTTKTERSTSAYETSLWKRNVSSRSGNTGGRQAPKHTAGRRPAKGTGQGPNPKAARPKAAAQQQRSNDGQRQDRQDPCMYHLFPSHFCHRRNCRWLFLARGQEAHPP